MTEQNITGVSVVKLGLGFRSRLLKPVVEGNKLASGDIDSFLGIRLCADEEKEDSEDLRRDFQVS